MQIDQRRAAQQYRNKVNNAQGQFFERAIKAACALYSERGRADVDKTPEPFRVLEKSRDGISRGGSRPERNRTFKGRWTVGVPSSLKRSTPPGTA